MQRKHTVIWHLLDSTQDSIGFTVVLCSSQNFSYESEELDSECDQRTSYMGRDSRSSKNLQILWPTVSLIWTYLMARDSPCFLRPVWAPWVQRVPWRWIAVAWDAAQKPSFTTVTGRGGIPLYINMYICTNMIKYVATSYINEIQ